MLIVGLAPAEPGQLARRGSGTDHAIARLRGPKTLSTARAVQATLLALQVVDITLPLTIGHALVTTLRILRQPIAILAALAIRHILVSALFFAAELS
jgi:hypothetical protein